MQLANVMSGESGERGNQPRGNLVCVGMIVGAHGVRGAVKVKSFTENPEDVTAYGPLSDQRGTRQYVLTPVGAARGNILAEIDGVDDRNAAEALRGTRLYVDRGVFPPAGEDEFYHADLIGMAAETVTGEALGTVRAVYNHGAGDVIELALPGGAMIALPFTKAVVPAVDLAGRRLVIDPPEGVMPADGVIPADGVRPEGKSA